MKLINLLSNEFVNWEMSWYNILSRLPLQRQKNIYTNTFCDDSISVSHRSISTSLRSTIDLRRNNYSKNKSPPASDFRICSKLTIFAVPVFGIFLFRCSGVPCSSAPRFINSPFPNLPAFLFFDKTGSLIMIGYKNPNLLALMLRMLPSAVRYKLLNSNGEQNLADY